MKKLDMTNVQEAGEWTRLPAGAYICTISKVEDMPAKEYLKVTYDIASGEFTGYYKRQREQFPWAGSYVKSYKTSALPMFKRFCTAVSRSNGNFVFDGGAINADEATLVGKKLGLLLGEEEYYSNSGDVKTRLYVVREFPIDKIADQRVPELKKLKEESIKPAVKTSSGDSFMNVPDSSTEEVPFL